MAAQGKNTFTDEELIEAYKETPYLTKLAARFGVPNITMFRRSKRLGLKYKNGGGAGRGKRLPLQEILEGKHPHYGTNKLKKRLLKEGIFESKCSSCDIVEWNGKPITMQLDHINGNSHDHVLDNLRVLCPNCHSQTDTWCGKNKKSVEKEKTKKSSRRKNWTSCLACDIKCPAAQKYCSAECSNKSRRKVSNRPSKEELAKLLETNSYLAVGRMYGVSDNAIRKWLK